MPMANVTKKPSVRDVALNLEVLVEDAGWQKKITRLKGKIVEAVEAALLTQHKLKLKSESYELSITLTSNDKIRKLNREHRNKDYATNVLSFPLADDGVQVTFPGVPVLLGDVILAHDVIEAEAKAEKKTFNNHTVHLVVHGVLHLCGYDHETTGQARTMEGLEKSILADLGLPNPYANP